jgi:hypothetical protein
LKFLNQKNPGFPRVAKVVFIEIQGKPFMLILFYSTFSFKVSVGERFDNFEKFIKTSSGKVMIEAF